MSDDKVNDALREQVKALSRIIIKAQSYAESDPEVALTQARKSAEAICRSVFQANIGEPGNIMLDELIRKLREKKLLPPKIVVPLGTIQAYGNFGTHAQSDFDEIDSAYAAPCLSALAQVTSWYFTEYLGIALPQELIQKNEEEILRPKTEIKNGKKKQPEKKVQKEKLQKKEDKDKNGVSKPNEDCYLNEDEVWEKEIEVEGVAIKMIYIPPGEFMMGSPDDDEDAWFYEKPRHKVIITKGFWLGKYEVTQGQWEAVTNENPSGFKEGAEYPVENVSWEDVQGLIKKLNAKTKSKFYLPSQAEWEYACRAGSEGKYCFGDDDDELSEYAWYRDNSDNKTHPVGEKQPNEWGLYDMHGNVCEWCQDWMDSEYYKKSPTRDPQGPSSGISRVACSGSWCINARGERAACFGGNDPGYRGSSLGFRLAAGSESG